MALGRMGAKGFDPAKEIAKEYPHKWNSGTLYRDFLRVVHRKYPEPQRTKYSSFLRAAFREHTFIDNEERMKLMGTGPTTLGSIAIEEEFFEKGIKHPEHPSRYDLIDTLSANIDCRRLHPLPYLIQRDLWYYFGLGEQQQDVIATKVHRIAKSKNEKYNERTVERRDECRQWILDRLALFEDSYAHSPQRDVSLISREQAKKVQEIFAALDSNNDGLVTYNDFHAVLNGSESNHLQMLHFGDNVTLSVETWHYMSDVLLSLADYLATNESAVSKETECVEKHLQISHLNPLYRAKGWTLSQLTDAYVKHEFFNLDTHYANIVGDGTENENEKVLGSKTKQNVYNLMVPLATNAPSIALTVAHAFATGQHLFVHILSAEDDPDAVTWEKLEELHSAMGTLSVIEQARKKEEIMPQDVLFYDPDQCSGEIPATIPDYSVFWHSVFEHQMQDLPDYVVQDYFDTIVMPDMEARNDGVFVAPKNGKARDRMIEEHVYAEMERFMQPWIWKRFAQYQRDPVFAVSTWTDYRLAMNRRR